MPMFGLAIYLLRPFLSPTRLIPLLPHLLLSISSLHAHLLTLRAKSLQLCPTLCNPMDCSPPGSSVHGILQARIVEWVAMPSSRESSRLRDLPMFLASFMSPALAGGFFTTSAIWEALGMNLKKKKGFQVSKARKKFLLLSLLPYLVLRQWTQGGLTWTERKGMLHYSKTLPSHIKLPHKSRSQNLPIDFQTTVSGPDLICRLFLDGLQTNNGFYILNSHTGASLVAQWWRMSANAGHTGLIPDPDAICSGAAKSVCQNYWACALEPRRHDSWSPCACLSTREAPAISSLHTATKERSLLLATREKPGHTRTAKIK